MAKAGTLKARIDKYKEQTGYAKSSFEERQALGKSLVDALEGINGRNGQNLLKEYEKLRKGYDI